MDKTSVGYQKHKRRVQERETEQSRSGRDLFEIIGAIPPPKDPVRRLRAMGDMRFALETYHGADFSLPWSSDHLADMLKIEQVARHGGRWAKAAPRGDGKTTRLERAELWAVLNGVRRFPVFLGAEKGAADESMATIKTELDSNEILAEDYPEVCLPCAAIEGIAQRCAGQLYLGHRTHMKWGQGLILLPMLDVSHWLQLPNGEQYRPFIRPDGLSLASCAIIRIASIMARIRGMKYKLPTGETVRPDFAIIDDPQTEKSAWSESQCEQRMRVIKGAVLKLAGPGQEISAFASVTVIRKGDLSDRLLDRQKNPEWQGVRSKMLYAFPTNEKLWADYEQVRADELRANADDARADVPTPKATAFYAERRCKPECVDVLDKPRECATCGRRETCMDAGAVVAWKHRHTPHELSAVQSAMNLKIEDEESFCAECQNEPKEARHDDTTLSADAIASRVNRHKRGLIPHWATRVTAFVDVGEKLLYWAVSAWNDEFTGAVVDYGTTPSQNRAFFAARDANPTLARIYPKAGLEGRISEGLAVTINALCSREWQRDDGANLRLERCMIDANWGQTSDVVYEFCRRSEHAAVLLPSHGKGIGASGLPFALWQPRQGERLGLNWALRSNPTKRVVRHVVFDTNFWKSFIHARLSMAMGDKGALTLFGDKPDLHRLFAEHLTAEYTVRTEGRGRTVDEWKQKPNNPDNHWFDCVVGCAVAASVCGCALPGTKAAKKNPAAGKSWSQLAREKRMNRQ